MISKKCQFVKLVLIFIYILEFSFLLINIFKLGKDYFIYNQPFIISILVTILSFFIIVMDKKMIIFKNLNIRNIIFSIILAILFIIMLPFSDIGINDNFKLFYFLIVVFSCFVCLIKVFTYKNKNSNFKNLSKIRIIILLIFTIITSLYIFSTNTGYYNEDMLFIWSNDMNYIFNWHTYAYSILVYLFRFVFKTTFSILILQGLLWILALDYSLKIIERETKDYKYLIYFAIISLVSLVGFKQVTFLWKDTIFSIGLYFYFLTIFDCFLLRKVTKKHIIFYLIFGFLVANFRHAGWLIIMINGIVLCLYILFIKQLKLFYLSSILTVIIIFTYFGINSFCDNVLKSGHYYNSVPYTVPIYQVGTFINNNYQFSSEDINYLEQLYPISIWKNNYIKNDGDSLARKWMVPSEYAYRIDSFNYSHLISLNFKMFITEPSLYLNSLLDLEKILWRLTSKNPCENFYYIKSPLIYTKNDKYNLYFKTTPINNITNMIDTIFLEMSPIKDLYMMGGFSTYMIILAIFLWVYQKKYKIALVSLPLILWWLLLIVSMPKGIIRYVIIFIISWPIYLLLAFFKNSCKNAK